METILLYTLSCTLFIYGCYISFLFYNLSSSYHELLNQELEFRQKYGALKDSYRYINLIIDKIPKGAEIFCCECDIYNVLEVSYRLNNIDYKLITSLGELVKEYYD